MMEFPILVKIWAGSQPHDMRYIRRSIPSLLASNLPSQAKIFLVNDCSTNPELMPFLKKAIQGHNQAQIITNEKNMGPNDGHVHHVPLLWEKFPQAPYMVCCDDDIIYHPDWLNRLISVYEESKKLGIKGIFSALNVPTRSHYDKAHLPTSEVLIKERQMALNWLIPRDVYDTVGPFRNTGIAYDSDYCDRMALLHLPVICLKPSYVQNIGYHGAYAYDELGTARDYVGRLDIYLIFREYLYKFRRRIINAGKRIGNRIPEGKLREIIRYLKRVLKVQIFD